MEHKSFLEGGKHSLTETKLNKLNAIGFDWGKRKGDVSWEEKFRQLSEYRNTYGNCEYRSVIFCVHSRFWTICSFSYVVSCHFQSFPGQVPTKFEDNPALGRWVSTQRSQYKLFVDGQRSTMTAARAERLGALGFVWNMLPPKSK